MGLGQIWAAGPKFKLCCSLHCQKTPAQLEAGKSTRDLAPKQLSGNSENNVSKFGFQIRAVSGWHVNREKVACSKALNKTRGKFDRREEWMNHMQMLVLKEETSLAPELAWNLSQDNGHRNPRVCE